MSKIKKGEPIARPDYEINKYSVYYVYIQDPCKYNTINSLLDGCADGDHHLILSADYLREQIAEFDDQTIVENNLDEEGIKALAILKEIIAILEKAKFGGDVWFYKN
jgi:hypothetical protein